VCDQTADIGITNLDVVNPETAAAAISEAHHAKGAWPLALSAPSGMELSYRITGHTARVIFGHG
jgi:hypothetical protein